VRKILFWGPTPQGGPQRRRLLPPRPVRMLASFLIFPAARGTRETHPNLQRVDRLACHFVVASAAVCRLSTLCCPSSSPRQRQRCSGSGHSRPQRELTVSATFRSSRRQRDRNADERSQGSADVARRMGVARWFPERQLNRCRGHWASKTNRMSAAHGAGLTHPTRSGRSNVEKPDVRHKGAHKP
jgi:hypothetical protein